MNAEPFDSIQWSQEAENWTIPLLKFQDNVHIRKEQIY